MLTEKEKRTLNDPASIAARDAWFTRMEGVFDGTPDPRDRQRLFTLCGFAPQPEDGTLAYRDPEGWCEEVLHRAAALPPCGANRFAPLAVEYPIFGVHFIDRVFGAEVFNLAGDGVNTFAWNARYLKTPVGELPVPDTEKDETWSLARRAAEAFVKAEVKLPLFGLPTLASPLNIFLNLYGQEGLLAMMEYPWAAARDLRLITDVIGFMHRWYREHIPAAQLQPVCSVTRTQPPGSGQVCGCTTQLLSPALYAETAAPLDDELLAIYPHGGMIHLCGGHTQHIPVFRAMKHLRAIQLNDRAAGDLELYLKGLREDQVLYVNPCPEMPRERILELAQGHRVILVEAIDAPEL